MKDAFTKNIPSLNEWLGDGQRAEGFEQWVKLLLQTEHADEDEQSALRFMQILGVAAIEGGNIETRRGRPFELTAAFLSRGMGAVCMVAIASCLREETPWRDVSIMLTEEFRLGAKYMAHLIEDAAEHASSARTDG